MRKNNRFLGVLTFFKQALNETERKLSRGLKYATVFYFDVDTDVDPTRQDRKKHCRL